MINTFLQLNGILIYSTRFITLGPILDMAIVHHERGDDRSEIKNYPEIENEDGVLTYNVTGNISIISVADLGGAPLARPTPTPPPPHGPKFSQFHAVFRKIWQNHVLASPESWRPLLRGILDPPLKLYLISNALRSMRSLALQPSEASSLQPNSRPSALHSIYSFSDFVFKIRLFRTHNLLIPSQKS